MTTVVVKLEAAGVPVSAAKAVGKLGSVAGVSSETDITFVGVFGVNETLTINAGAGFFEYTAN